MRAANASVIVDAKQNGATFQIEKCHKGLCQYVVLYAIPLELYSRVLTVTD